jgi:hypothetical protein
VFYEPLGFLRGLNPIHLSKNYEYFKQKHKKYQALTGLSFPYPLAYTRGLGKLDGIKGMENIIPLEKEDGDTKEGN